MFYKIGEKRMWSFENLYGEETYRKDGNDYYVLVRKLMFGRFLLQLYKADSVIVLNSTYIDEPTEDELNGFFSLGETWVSNNISK